jgi:hypothetical protein
MSLALRANVKYVQFGYPAELWVRVRGVLAQVKTIKIDVPYFRRNDNLWSKTCYLDFDMTPEFQDLELQKKAAGLCFPSPPFYLLGDQLFRRI